MLINSLLPYLLIFGVIFFYLYPRVSSEAAPQSHGPLHQFNPGPLAGSHASAASYYGLHPAAGPGYGLGHSLQNPGPGYFGPNYGPVYGGGPQYPPYVPHRGDYGHGVPFYGTPYSSAAASSSI